MLKDFKPTVFFLLKFFGVYIVCSILYGIYIKHFDQQQPPKVDGVTHFVTTNIAWVGEVLGYKTSVLQNDHLNKGSEIEQTFDSFFINDAYAISVEEGCNGLNIIILFMAFVIAFGGELKRMGLFIPAGILFIHICNIGRLLLLSIINVEWGGRAFHFFHKYGFTAVIYLAVLLLWFLWVGQLSGVLKRRHTGEIQKDEVELS